MRILSCMLFCLSLAYAGGGPESVALIVNLKSDDSREIANYYAHVRKVPDINIIYLDDVPDQNTISLKQFREQILAPIFMQLQQRKIAGQIDYITYSCGFPTRVTFDRKFAQQLNWVANPQASLTGMTYLYQLSSKDEKAFLDPNCNFYFRQSRVDVDIDPNIKKASKEDTQAIDAFFTEKHKRDRKRKKDKAEKNQADKDWESAGWQQALKDLSSLAEQFPQDPSVLYNLACTQAMCTQADAAVQTLKRCVQNGYVNWAHMSGDADLASLRQRDDFKNIITKLKHTPLVSLPSMGFSAQRTFNRQGQVVAADKGLRYLIATMLGYTGERGNTVSEIKSYLSKAAQADGTHPKGCVYFPLNGDIRSKTREWAVYHCSKVINEKGIEAKITRGTIPKNANNVIGVHAGIAGFDWPNSGSTLLPGAIGEHLTSWGAEFERQGQTKISSWLRAGAAGSAGTISEPYALKFKFPNAFLYVHYVNGCSLGEAFYQSIASPYELLILGDALCQPYAHFNEISISNIPSQSLSTAIDLTITAKNEIAGYIAFLNGRAVAKGTATSPLHLDPSTLAPGHYQLSLVCLDKSIIQTRTAVYYAIHIGDDKQISSCEAKRDGDTIKINFACKPSDEFSKIVFLHHGRLVGSSEKTTGTVSIEKIHVSSGPITIRPAILNSDGKVLYHGQLLDVEW